MALYPLRMLTIVYNTWGAIHLLAALLSLVLGTAVLVAPKKRNIHRKAGYAYLTCMAVMIATAFGIYRQYNALGIFHLAAVLTLLTLLAGMLPVLFKKRLRQWLRLHNGFMYLSVLELYIALVAEFLVRIPQATFMTVATLSSAVVLIPGSVLFLTRFAKQ